MTEDGDDEYHLIGAGPEPEESAGDDVVSAPRRPRRRGGVALTVIGLALLLAGLGALG